MLTTHYKSSKVTCVSSGPVFLSCYRDIPTIQDIEDIERAVEKVAAAEGKLLHFAVVTSLDVKVPDDVRVRGASFLKKVDPLLDAAGTVILVGGIYATVVRTLLTGIGMMNRGKAPTKTLDSMESAWAWVQTLPCSSKLTPAIRAELSNFIASATQKKAA